MSKFRICALAALLSALIMGAQAQQMPAPTQPPAKTAPQTQQVLPSYEGQNVSSVEVAGDPSLNQAQLLPMLPQKVGEPFSQEKVNASIAALNATGRFKGVQLQVVPDIKGVRVLLVVQPGMYFGMYSFPGALSNFAYSQLLQVSDYPPEGPYSITDVNNASAALVRSFQRNGFFLAKVNPTLQTDRKTGIVNVVFNTDLGKRARFGKVTIEGADAQETAHLNNVLHSIVARLKGSAIRQGKTYHLKTVQNATMYLQSAMSKQAHLGAT